MISLAFSPLACATCLPVGGSVEAEAQGYAILFMLGVLAVVFSILFFTIYSFAKRQRQYAQAIN